MDKDDDGALRYHIEFHCEFDPERLVTIICCGIGALMLLARWLW